MSQLPLFSTEPALPDGFRYRPDLVSAEEERLLVEHLRELPFQEFQFQGYVGKRRVVSYGWRYDFNQRELQPAEPLPPFLLSVRAAAAGWAEIDPARLEHVLITEYAPGAGIGWHRDKREFGEVIGVLLLSPALFRLRRQTGHTWERASLRLEPRSAYLLRGPARTEWEHSIPEAETLRYSLTFRTLR
ncbi:MAG: alpha-ketoglutarate-dependent dioxygenase AlkB [Armatimonadota bacterium]